MVENVRLVGTFGRRVLSCQQSGITLCSVDARLRCEECLKPVCEAHIYSSRFVQTSGGDRRWPCLCRTCIELERHHEQGADTIGLVARIIFLGEARHLIGEWDLRHIAGLIERPFLIPIDGEKGGT